MADNMKPQSGAWDNLSSDDFNPGVKFEINIPVKVTFPDDFDKPKELPDSKGEGVFYSFPVKISGEERTINTSAWSLLHALKGHEPLAGKTVLITKKLLDGKQKFFVEVEGGEHPREVSSTQA